MMSGERQRKLEKIEVQPIKEEAPSRGTFFSNPSISISSFNEIFCFFQNPLQIWKNKKKKQTKHKQTKHKQTKHIVPLPKSISTGAQYVTPDSKIYCEKIKMCLFSSGGNWFSCTKLVQQLAAVGKGLG
jgi:hypothetical protein